MHIVNVYMFMKTHVYSTSTYHHEVKIFIGM